MTRFQLRPTASGGYLWRMLSTNNRTVAVPPAEFPNRDACNEHLHQTMAVARTRNPEPQQREPITWIWVLRNTDGVELARSYASYSRLVDCRHAIQRFANAIPRGTQPTHPQPARQRPPDTTTPILSATPPS